MGDPTIAAPGEYELHLANVEKKAEAKNIDPAIQKQLEFVEWLKEKGLYDPMATSTTMQKMYAVWAQFEGLEMEMLEMAESMEMMEEDQGDD
jgi:hypothetical protein